MKKIHLSVITLLVFGVSILFTACEKSSSEDLSGSIVGTWTIESTSMDATINGVSFIDYYKETFGLTQADADALLKLFKEEFEMAGSITINADGTYTAVFDGENDEGTWRLSDDKKTLTIDDNTQYEMVFTVKKLTDSELVLVGSESDTKDINEDGTDENLVITVQMNFKR